MKPILILSFFGIIIFNPACSNHPSAELPEAVRELDNVTIFESDTSPQTTLTLSNETTLGNDEELLFGRISHIEADTNEYVYLSDGSRGNEAIYVFDPEGHFINRIGRSGEGPGEFRSIFDIEIFENRLLVLDGNLHRIQTFSTDDHSLIHEAQLDPSEWDHSDEESLIFPEELHVLNDSTQLAAFNHSTFDIDTKSYYHLDRNGNVISDRIFTHDFIKHLKDPSSSHYFFDPFGGRGITRLSGNGELISAWSEEMLFTVYDIYGEYLRAFYHPFSNSRLDRGEALEFHGSDQFRSALLHHGIPEEWRAFEHFLIDDESRLWVSAITDNRDIYTWWIMDDRGGIIAKTELPRHIEVKSIKNDILYSLNTDEETGEERVVKYRLEWGN